MAEFHEIDQSKRINLKTLIEAKTKIVALEGGSGSGKTWDVIFYLLWICQENENQGLSIMIGRACYAWIEDSVLDSFMKILRLLDLWNGKLTKESHPKEHTIYGNTFHFRGADQEAKFHGPRWDIVYLNEAMEFEYESCAQLFMRTNYKILLDWNPYLMQHWVFDRILTRQDCTHVISTFFDNPDLPEEQRKEILGYEPTHPEDRDKPEKERRPHPINIQNGTADDRLWSIYGQGIRQAPTGIIFKYVNYIDKWPIDVDYINSIDFGFTTDPCVIGKVGETDRDIFIEVMSYEPIETPEEIDLYADRVGLDKKRITVADSSDRYVSENKGVIEMVNNLRDLGWKNITKVSKTRSVMYWIGEMKKKRINFISNNFVDKIKKEQENYVMKTINGIAINQPIDKFNHIFDMARYGVMILNARTGIKSVKR